MDTTLEVDLNKVKNFIESPEFATFLLDNTEDFAVAAYILQTLLDAVEAAAARIDNE